MRLSSSFPGWRRAWRAGLREFLGALPITNAGFRNRSSDIEQTSDARADALVMASFDTLEVIGAGWCRTGTSSLKVALDLLGCSPSFHGRFIPYLPELREDCYKYATGRIATFDVRKSFGGYRAAVDIPPGLIPLVLEAYPEAKVILTVRDEDKWHQSVKDVIVRLYDYLLRPFFWHTRLGRQYTAIIGWGLQYMFQGDLSKENCVRAFRQHTEDVKGKVPAEQLLIWKPQDGWEPLASFLGVPVPKQSFPPPQNEGSREMLMQMFCFIWRNPLASIGARVHSHEGPMLFDSI